MSNGSEPNLMFFLPGDGAASIQGLSMTSGSTTRTADRQEWQASAPSNEQSSEPAAGKRRRGRPKGSQDKRPRRGPLSRMSLREPAPPRSGVPWQPGPVVLQQQQPSVPNIMEPPEYPSSFSASWPSNGPTTNQQGGRLMTKPSGTSPENFQPCAVPRNPPHLPIWSSYPTPRSSSRPPPALVTPAPYHDFFLKSPDTFEAQMWEPQTGLGIPMHDHGMSFQEPHKLYLAAAALSPRPLAAPNGTGSAYHDSWISETLPRGLGDRQRSDQPVNSTDSPTAPPQRHPQHRIPGSFHKHRQQPSARNRRNEVPGTETRVIPQASPKSPKHSARNRRNEVPRTHRHEIRDDPNLMRYSSAHQDFMFNNHPRSINPNVRQLSLDVANCGGSELFDSGNTSQKVRNCLLAALFNVPA